MYELVIKDEIASAHFLRGYEGKCRHLHGHTWKVEVFLRGDKLNGIGMLADFKTLKETLKNFLAPMDHVCLNDLPQFADVNPTAERLAEHIAHEFAPLVEPLRLVKVLVWESERAGAAYYPD